MHITAVFISVFTAQRLRKDKKKKIEKKTVTTTTKWMLFQLGENFLLYAIETREGDGDTRANTTPWRRYNRNRQAWAQERENFIMRIYYLSDRLPSLCNTYIFHLMDFIEMKNHTKHEWYKFSSFFSSPFLPSIRCSVFVVVLFATWLKSFLSDFTDISFMDAFIFHGLFTRKPMRKIKKAGRQSFAASLLVLVFFCLIRNNLTFIFSVWPDAIEILNIYWFMVDHLLRFRVPFPILPCPCCIAFRMIWWSPTWPLPIPCILRSAQTIRREHICRFVAMVAVPLHRTMANPCHRPHCRSHASVDWNDRTFRCWNRMRK